VLPGTDPAEERRLLFVAMTRARSRLFLTYAGRRSRSGREMPAGASPLLRILGPDVVTSTAAVPRQRQPQQLRLL
jgi:DNA helicase-2/ATP-dependent DNA helicase PcrA